MDQLTDQEIIATIQNGQDSEAIEYLYRSLLPKVKKHVCGNSGSLDDAYDVFQETVMRFYKLVVERKFEVEKYTVHGFMFTMSKNIWINLVKKRASVQNREQQSLNDNHEDTILERIIDKEKTNALKNLFNTLGERCTEILTYFYYLKKPQKEIAELMGMTEDAVKVKNFRCKKQLMDRIKNNKQVFELLKN